MHKKCKIVSVTSSYNTSSMNLHESKLNFSLDIL